LKSLLVYDGSRVAERGFVNSHICGGFSVGRKNTVVFNISIRKKKKVKNLSTRFVKKFVIRLHIAALKKKIIQKICKVNKDSYGKT
jgi:hypothetical protein